jgi:hypothetical protein
MNIEIIANDYDLKIIYIDSLDDTSIDKNFYGKNQCFLADGQIYVGIYDDEEKKLISIFHEIGHAFLTKYETEKYKYIPLLCELACWRIGIDIAIEKYNYYFSDETIVWAYSQAFTYKEEKERNMK